MIEFNPSLGEEGSEGSKQPNRDMLIYEIFKLLHEGGSVVEFAAAEDYLNHIAFHGIGRTAELVWETLDSDRLLRPVADAAEVREYLRWVQIDPPLRITDIGAVDEVFIRDAKLTEDFVEELSELLSFVDPNRNEISVLDIPNAVEKMRDAGIANFKRYLTLLVMDMHGISYRVVREDERALVKLGTFVEEFSQELYREYSWHLRDRRNREDERTPIAKVTAMMDDIKQKQQREIELALSNIEVSAHERARLLEMLPERMRERIDSFIAEANEINAEEPQSPPIGK